MYCLEIAAAILMEKMWNTYCTYSIMEIDIHYIQHAEAVDKREVAL